MAMKAALSDYPTDGKDHGFVVELTNRLACTGRVELSDCDETLIKSVPFQGTTDEFKEILLTEIDIARNNEIFITIFAEENDIVLRNRVFIVNAEERTSGFIKEDQIGSLLDYKILRI